MSRIAHHLRTHPGLSVPLVGVVAFLLFAVLVPLPYSATVGYTVSLNGIESGTAVSPVQITNALATLGYDKTSVNHRIFEASASITISGLPTKQAAREAVAVFKTLTGQTPQADIEPVVKQVSGTLYAQAADYLFRVEVDGAGKTDAQIAAEIATQLEAQGMTNANVSFESTPDGQKQITVEYEGEGTSQIEFQFDSTK